MIPEEQTYSSNMTSKQTESKFDSQTSGDSKQKIQSIKENLEQKLMFLKHELHESIDEIYSKKAKTAKQKKVMPSLSHHH